MVTLPTKNGDVIRRYVEDVFMQARDCSRNLHKIHGKLEELAKQQRETGVSEHEIAVSEFLAAMTPQAVAIAEHLTAALGTYTQAIYDLGGADVDRLIRPMFAAAGREDDFMDARERDGSRVKPPRRARRA
jgi:hypothetical protein